jgi:curli biogenesis system outer membrane secretion channel CsgG
MKPILQTLIVFFCLHIGFAQPLSFHSAGFAPKRVKGMMLPLKDIHASKGIFPNQIQVTWPSKGRGCMYMVYRSESPNSRGKAIDTSWLETEHLSDRQIIPNKKYYYSVKYQLDGLESELSEADFGFAKSEPSRAAVDEKMSEEPVMAPLKDVIATGGTLENEIQITWTAKGNGYEYLIYRSETPNKSGKPINKWQEVNQFTDRNVNPDKKYYYSVKYRNIFGLGESELSVADVGFAKAESKVKDRYISFEELKEICKDVPMGKHVPIVVLPFSVSSKTKDISGIEFSEMLTNALIELGCFKVLEYKEFIKNSTDERENYLKNENDPDRLMTDARFRSVQLFVTGYITEFSETESISPLGIALTKSKKAHVGFILKVFNPQDRSVLYSEAIDAEAKIGGFNGVSLLGFKVAGVSKMSKALREATESAIIQACGKLAENAYKYYQAQPLNYQNTTINISNANYSKIVELNKLINELLYKENIIKKDFPILSDSSDSTGKILISHKGTIEDLAKLLTTKLGTKIEVTKVEKDRIYLILKE